MSDTVAADITAAGSGKSEAEVAFELLNKLKGQGVWGERNISDILDMYAECLDAAKGLRAYEGQRRVEVPIQGAKAEPILRSAPQQAPAAAPLARQTPPLQTQQPQQPVQAQVQQPIHAQQQALAQAYKPA